MIDTIKNCQDKYKQEKGKVIVMKGHLNKMIKSKKGDGLGTIVMIILVLLLVGSLVFTKVAPLVSKTSGAGNTANKEVNDAIGEIIKDAGSTGEFVPDPGTGDD